jgi:hypothetical protein
MSGAELVIVWLLCVTLHANERLECISAWPTERACYTEEKGWVIRAAAWSDRSGLARSVMADCRIGSIERVQTNLQKPNTEEVRR